MPLHASRAAVIVPVVLTAIVLGSPLAAAWRANTLPLWPTPEPGADWTFSLMLANTGNASFIVRDFVVWTDWGPTPSSAEPAHTTTSLPVVLLPDSVNGFNFSFAVPASAAGGTFRLQARLVAGDSDGSGGWRDPAGANFGKAFNFTVGQTGRSPSMLGWTVGGVPLEVVLVPVGAIAAGYAVLVLRKRRAGASSSREGRPSQAQPGRPTPPKAP